MFAGLPLFANGDQMQNLSAEQHYLQAKYKTAHKPTKNMKQLLRLLLGFVLHYCIIIYPKQLVIFLHCLRYVFSL